MKQQNSDRTSLAWRCGDSPIDDDSLAAGSDPSQSVASVSSVAPLSTTSPRAFHGGCAALLLLLILPSPARAAVLSVEEFNAQSADWPALAERQQLVTLEGRYTSIIRTRLAMKNCELVFRPDKGKELPKVAADSLRIEVSGKLALDGGKPVFIVDRVRELSSDLDDVRRRAGLLRRDKADDWYALGDWARRRAAFYKDADLDKEATSLIQHGFDVERRSVPADKPEQYLTLAVKAVELKLPEKLREELVHRGHRERWDIARKEKAPPFRELAEALARDLPGSTVPLEPPLPKLEQRYHEKPLAVYDEAPSDERRKLHRLLYAAVVLAEIRSRAKADGANGLAIAQEIDEQIPEQHDLAESFRERELQWRLGKVATATRAEVIALARLFRDRNQPDLEKKTKQTWLAKREEFARKDGPDALKLLADDYRSLLEDDAKAAALLLDAWKESPDSKEIAQKLENLGYRLKDGQWLTKAAFRAIPVDPIQKAMSAGEVVPGMTRAQVRKTLGAPAAILRVATADEISEVWTYGGKNASGLSVRIVRQARQSDDGKVVDVQKTR